jgi:hypothetical protein
VRVGLDFEQNGNGMSRDRSDRRATASGGGAAGSECRAKVGESRAMAWRESRKGGDHAPVRHRLPSPGRSRLREAREAAHVGLASAVCGRDATSHDADRERRGRAPGPDGPGTHAPGTARRATLAIGPVRKRCGARSHPFTRAVAPLDSPVPTLIRPTSPLTCATPPSARATPRTRAPRPEHARHDTEPTRHTPRAPPRAHSVKNTNAGARRPMWETVNTGALSPG